MKLLRELRSLFRKEKLDAEMAAEMRAHLELHEAENIARGMSAEEARYAAQRSFGGTEQIKERVRDQRGFGWVDHLRQDVRYAARQLRKTPGFTLVAVLSLALGIGANTALFSLVDVVLLKTLPVENPEQLVVLTHQGTFHAAAPNWMQMVGERGSDPKSGEGTMNVFAPAVFQRLRDGHSALVAVFAFGRMREVNAVVEGEAEVIPTVQVVTGNYCAELGVGLVAGRGLTDEDDRAAAAPAALISHRYWRARFAESRDVIGKTMWLSGVAVTIVGITEEGFSGTLQVGESPALFVPLALAARLRPDNDRRFDADQARYWWLRIMGRLAPGATAEQARQELEPIFRQSILDYQLARTEESAFPRLHVTRSARGLLEDRQAQRQPLLILTGVVALVLVAACANIANLLLARGAARRKEIAVRLALGASRGRIVGQLLTESFLIALLGFVVGLALAWWGKDLLLALRAANGHVLDLTFNGKVLAATAAVTITTSVGFGLAPALRATKLDLSAEFQGQSQRGRRRFALGKALAVVQVALSLVLLVGLGLFAQTLRNLRRVDVGFDRSRLLLFGVNTPTPDRGKAAALYQRIKERLGVLPGVRAVAFATVPPLSRQFDGHGGSLWGENGSGAVRTDLGGDIIGVSAGYFETLQLPIVAGRGITQADEASPTRVAVINESMARKFFPNENPIGQLTNYGEIVGVARDARMVDVKRPIEPTVYVRFQRISWNTGQGNFVVRTDGDPAVAIASIRRAVREVDASLPLLDLRTQSEQVGRLMQEELFFARLVGGFGVVALGLACMGLSGLISFAVVQRTREIGIRIALGAQSETVVGMILGEFAMLVTLGTMLGLVAALGATRLVAHLLFGVSPAEPLIFGGVTGLLVVVALASCWLPARRAARIDPTIALRAE